MASMMHPQKIQALLKLGRVGHKADPRSEPKGRGGREAGFC